MIQVPVVLTTAAEQVDHMAASYARIPLAVRIPGRLIDQLPQRISELLASTEWTFLVGGWAEPILAMLPESSRRAQLERELVLLRATGIDRLAGFVGEGWEPGLASLFASLGINEVFVTWRDDPPPHPVLMDHIGDVVTIFPVGGALSPLLKNPGALDGEPAVPFELLATRLTRGEPPIDRLWVGAIAADAEGSLLYRKMLRLAHRLPDRMPPEATEWLESAQAGHWYKPGTDRRTAHSALAAARHRIDLGRRRPNDWTRLSVLDWDADASDEVQVETPELSLVIDAEEGMVLYVDHKPSERSVSYLPGQAPWHIAQSMTAEVPNRMTFALTGVEEARGRVGATMLGEGVEVGLAASRDKIEFQYRITGESDWQRLGPEISFAFSGPIRYRLDGSPWLTVAAPVALNGHRFRLEHGSEHVLVTALQPADFFLRPVPGGVVVWANWPLAPFGIPQDDPPAVQLGVEYGLTVEITG
jgi:hypothetical protein